MIVDTAHMYQRISVAHRPPRAVEACDEIECLSVVATLIVVGLTGVHPIGIDATRYKSAVQTTPVIVARILAVGIIDAHTFVARIKYWS